MRNLLAFFGAAVVVLLGLGWYLGWYSITSQNAGPGQTRLQVDINKTKITTDVEEGAHKTAETIQGAIDKAKQGNATTPDAKSPTSAPTSNAPSGKDDKASKAASNKVREDVGNLILDGWEAGNKK
jgi:hypothetical protein